MFCDAQRVWSRICYDYIYPQISSMVIKCLCWMNMLIVGKQKKRWLLHCLRVGCTEVGLNWCSSCVSRRYLMCPCVDNKSWWEPSWMMLDPVNGAVLLVAVLLQGWTRMAAKSSESPITPLWFWTLILWFQQLAPNLQSESDWPRTTFVPGNHLYCDEETFKTEIN